MIAAHIEPILIVTGAVTVIALITVSPVSESLSRVPMLRRGPLRLLHWNTLGIENRVTSA